MTHCNKCLRFNRFKWMKYRIESVHANKDWCVWTTAHERISNSTCFYSGIPIDSNVLKNWIFATFFHLRIIKTFFKRRTNRVSMVKTILWFMPYCNLCVSFWWLYQIIIFRTVILRLANLLANALHAFIFYCVTLILSEHIVFISVIKIHFYCLLPFLTHFYCLQCINNVGGTSQFLFMHVREHIYIHERIKYDKYKQRMKYNAKPKIREYTDKVRTYIFSSNYHGIDMRISDELYLSIYFYDNTKK